MGNTTRNGDGANDRGHSDPIGNGDAFETTNYSDPLSDEKDTPIKCRLDSTDVYIYKGALLPVELLRIHPQMVSCSSTEGLNT